MSALDQAFFKAYMQVEAASSAVSVAAARTAQSSEVLLAKRPEPQATVAGRNTSLDNVLAALSEPPPKREPATVAPTRNQTSSGDVGLRPTVAAVSVPTCLQPGAATRPLAATGPEPAKTAFTPPELDPREALYRVDAAGPSVPSLAGGRPLVPPPHLSVVALEAADEAAEMATNGPADDDAAKCTARGIGLGPFQPLLQVDRFTWPKTCTRLMVAAAEELDHLTDALLAGEARGQKVLGIAGCRRGEGSTTILLCTARRLAERGLRVVLVDADLAEPQLARRLGVLPQAGWEAVWSGRLPLAEVVIESIENRLALLPLCETFAAGGPGLGGKTTVAESLDTLAANFDLVLVDVGPLEDPAVIGGSIGREISRRLDGMILVQNVRVAARERMTEVQRRLAAAGIVQAGIVENLVHDETPRRNEG